MAKKFYITTAIAYVNSDPHLGFAYELIIADCLARWHNLLKEDVFFLTGTDENAQKNYQVAKERKIAPKKFVDENSKKFEKLCKVLNISNNDFIKTTEKRHVQVAQEIFKKVYDNGDIYKGTYEGYYCNGCESFLTEKDLVNGKCPEHNKEPEWLKEEGYFFKMSKYQEKVLKLLKTKDFVIPASKRNEMINRIEEQGLKDLSVSRAKLEWGIPLPIDKNNIIYVWFDALLNYVSALGYPNDKNYKKYWPADIHLIGKGINWFHSVIWPSILISANIPLPKTILVHGYVNLGGKKLSKSSGIVVDPFDLSRKYPTDSIRYFLLRHIPFGEDGDFSEKALVDRHNNELADKLGNLVSRVAALAEKNGIEKTENKLIKKLELNKIEKHLENYEFDKALNLIFAFIDICNEYVQDKKPWETKDKKILYELVDSIKAVAILLWPFIPETSEKIAKQFKFDIKLENIKKPLNVSKIKREKILFEKIR